MPAGDTRAAGYHLPYPLTLVRGDGPRVWDADGNEYWDLAGNFTSLVHGHAYPPIVAAATAAVATGTAWPARNPGQIELAELLTQRIASVEQLRFCNSGTEAGLLAQVVARIVTGRPKILMARFGYHGAHEIFEHGSFDGRLAVPGNDLTLLADHGDVESFEKVLANHGHEVAAIVLEPVMGSAGLVAPPPEFFQRIQSVTHAHGALLVIDEVISLRMATGGMQSLLGIDPDLTMLGKIIGGGFPVGAIGGKAEYMAVMDPRQPRLFHSGTFNGNPVTVAAGKASVTELTSTRIDEMARLAEILERGLHDAARRHGLPFSTRRVGSLLQAYFADEAPAANLVRDDAAMIAAFHLAGMNHGLYFPARGLLVLSTVIDETAVADVLGRADAAMADVAAQR